MYPSVLYNFELMDLSKRFGFALPTWHPDICIICPPAYSICFTKHWKMIVEIVLILRDKLSKKYNEAVQFCLPITSKTMKALMLILVLFKSV